MKKFALKNSQNETLSLCEAESIEEATKYFSIVKDLSISDLLKIYNVVEMKV